MTLTIDIYENHVVINGKSYSFAKAIDMYPWIEKYL